MSAPEVSKIKPLVRRDGEPAFDEAWQAELLALGNALTEAGVFSPTEIVRGTRRRATLAVETHENWLEAHRYLNMDDLKEHKKAQLRQAA